MNPDILRQTASRLLPHLTLAATLSLGLWSGAATALSSDRSKPIDIAADSVDINEAKGQSTYSGHVEINQGSIRLQADKVVVDHRPGQPRRITATGAPARFRQLPDNSKEYVTGSARHIEYGLDSEELLMKGDASLKQGKDSFTSDRIVYDRVRSVVKAGAAAQGKERVKVTIQPGK
jgi:lipopolysaccharide export system protein LptA